MSNIIFKNISHYYNNKAAVKGLSFEFEDGKITAILGKSGSGKSTLLQIINGLIKPSEGNVSIFGEKLNYKELSKVRLKIGYSVQGTGLFPHMSIYDNITILGRITGVSKHDIERRADTLMSFVNLPPEYKTKYPYQLSGGEQQRAGICRAMLLNPPVFLLDEAFGALDDETKNEIHNEFLLMQKAEPRTVVLVTHDIDEAFKLADNIILMENGEIIQHAPKSEVIQAPKSSYLNEYLKGRVYT